MSDLVNAFGAITLESTQQQILDLQKQIAAQTKMLQIYLSHIAENMPRTDAYNRAIVNTSDQGNVTVAIASAQTLATVTTVGTISTLGASPTNAIPMHLSNAGSNYIYDRIVVS